MLETLNKIFASQQIEGPDQVVVPLHSNTSRQQGLFLQQIFDDVKPRKSLEVGLAYGISTLFILEKHWQYKNGPKCHMVIEPFPWGGVAEHNIRKEDLNEFIDIKYELSDKVLPRLYMDKHRIQYAYVDTTKLFDTVLHDFYFIDKILDVHGVIIFDDCGAGCPGVQRVVRFISKLPHYKLFATHNRAPQSLKRTIASLFVRQLVRLIPFKTKIFPTTSFDSDEQLGLDSSCIAFIKVANDTRSWDWDKAF